MISFLSGILVEKVAPQLILEVNGVGYAVQASLTTFAALPALGERVKLLTHFVVREDAQQLYGFYDSVERQLFRTLIKVNGVGPKLALAILSGMDSSLFSRYVLAGDISALTRLPGVGRKTAERLIVEMKDRLPEWHVDGIALVSGDGVVAAEGEQAVMLGEAETALIALGYKPTEASKMLANVDFQSVDSSEALIRTALQSLINR